MKKFTKNVEKIRKKNLESIAKKKSQTQTLFELEKSKKKKNK